MHRTTLHCHSPRRPPLQSSGRRPKEAWVPLLVCSTALWIQLTTWPNKRSLRRPHQSSTNTAPWGKVAQQLRRRGVGMESTCKRPSGHAGVLSRNPMNLSSLHVAFFETRMCTTLKPTRSPVRQEVLQVCIVSAVNARNMMRALLAKHTLRATKARSECSLSHTHYNKQPGPLLLQND